MPIEHIPSPNGRVHCTVTLKDRVFVFQITGGTIQTEKTDAEGHLHVRREHLVDDGKPLDTKPLRGRLA